MHYLPDDNPLVHLNTECCFPQSHLQPPTLEMLVKKPYHLGQHYRNVN